MRISVPFRNPCSIGATQLLGQHSKHALDVSVATRTARSRYLICRQPSRPSPNRKSVTPGPELIARSGDCFGSLRRRSVSAESLGAPGARFPLASILPLGPLMVPEDTFRNLAI